MSREISISSARRSEMDRPLPSAKSVKFPVGSIMEIVGLRTDSYTVNGEEQANDKLEVSVTGAGTLDGKFILPVRELLKAQVAEGSAPLYNEEGDRTFFPTRLEVKASEDRKDRENNPVYPVQAYNAFESQIESGSGVDWNALVASGVKADNKLEPVQNYTFFIEG